MDPGPLIQPVRGRLQIIKTDEKAINWYASEIMQPKKTI